MADDDEDMGTSFLNSHRTEHQRDKWDTGLSAGNTIDTEGRVRPNKMLRDRMNTGLGTMGTDGWGDGKERREMRKVSKPEGRGITQSGSKGTSTTKDASYQAPGSMSGDYVDEYSPTNFNAGGSKRVNRSKKGNKG